jgi:hypothetical protein
LYVHLNRLESARVIYCYQTATLAGWYSAVNAAEPMSMAPVILIRRLLDVQRDGWAALSSLPRWHDEISLMTSAGFPDLVTLIRFLLRQVVHRLRRKLLHHLRGEPKWFICFRRNRTQFTSVQPQFRSEGFTPVPNPDHSTFADPFVFERDGKIYLFVEEIVTATGRGHFSACQIQPGGISAFEKVLEKPWHLSYPCLIECEGDVFMIPENGANMTLDLYRAESFPHGWRLEKRIHEGIALVDTTPFHYGGVWYFFTTTVDVVTGRRLETWLFYSDRLDGDWHYHPANPICSDIRRARSAGHLFRREDKLFRPAQDCSIRYGYAIVLNWVRKLTTTEYEEEVEEVILPNWMPGLFATHTLNSVADVEVIDATRIPVSKS